MAKNKKSQAASIRFGPALAASFVCLVIAGAAVGYVWQKGQVIQLGKQYRIAESKLAQLRDDNESMAKTLADMKSPLRLDQRVQELRLGLIPARPSQVFRMPEPMTQENNNLPRQFAARPNQETTQ
ncbi:MAG TPA: hypothetical protein VFV23_07935 [Verrucomicrobiae bacterium]|nr:hypothetical protein [Verrucomicrobiae bacterium]